MVEATRELVERATGSHHRHLRRGKKNMLDQFIRGFLYAAVAETIQREYDKLAKARKSHKKFNRGTLEVAKRALDALFQGEG